MNTKILMGIGLFLISTLFIMGINSERIIVSNTIRQDNDLNDSSKGVPIKVAATNSYELELNFTWGGDQPDHANAIALNSTGYIYITGATSSFGAVANDLFLAKFNENGILTDNVTWGGTGNDDGSALALGKQYFGTPSGTHIYIAGSTSSFGASNYDILGARCVDAFPSEDDILWEGYGSWGDSNADFGRDILLDSSENIYICGDIYNVSDGDYDAFTAVFDEDYNSLMNITFDYGIDHGYAVALDSSGDIYMTGQADSYAYAARYDGSTGTPVGGIIWDRESVGRDIWVDPSGNTYVVGEVFTGASFDAFVAKYNITGDSVFNITWAYSGADKADAIALDDEGNIYITGYTDSLGLGDFDVFIAKYDNNGTSLVNITWGDIGNDLAYDIVLDDEGNIYITGQTTSFGAGGNDAFVAKYRPVTSQVVIPSDGGGGGGGSDSKSSTTIPLGNWFIVFLFIGLALIILKSKKKSKIQF